MKIAVIGVGVIGISMAYKRCKGGHEVAALERRSAAAEESSFAIAGIIAPSLVAPWAPLGMPAKALQQLLRLCATAKLACAPLTTRELAWLWRCDRSCRLETYLTNRTHLQKLAFYSQARLQALTTERQRHDERSEG
jgi:D-amino-acid dehydrogenase